jgi:hypothetical protein
MLDAAPSREVVLRWANEANARVIMALVALQSNIRSAMTPTRIVLDTDPGIDDALAILLALASPEVELVGLTVTGGNCTMEQGVRNGLSVLALGGASEIPVAAGVALPLIRPAYTAPETHGFTGLGYASLPPSPVGAVAEHAVDMLIREIMSSPEQVTLVAVGPLTNVALALRKEPRIIQAVREVIIMGGALRADGNTTPLAEFNVYVDPHAAHMVLHSGMPIALIPWGCCVFPRRSQASLPMQPASISSFTSSTSASPPARSTTPQRWRWFTRRIWRARCRSMLMWRSPAKQPWAKR